jgi:hypothetical protein
MVNLNGAGDCSVEVNHTPISPVSYPIVFIFKLARIINNFFVAIASAHPPFCTVLQPSQSLGMGKAGHNFLTTPAAGGRAQMRVNEVCLNLI